MGVDLRMEPYAEMYQAERQESGIPDEFYFQNVDGVFESLGLVWDDYSVVDELDDRGRFPHKAALKISEALEGNQVPHEVGARELLVKRREKLLTMLRVYVEWHEHPERILVQMQEIVAGRAPGMKDRASDLQDRRPWLALALS